MSYISYKNRIRSLIFFTILVGCISAQLFSSSFEVSDTPKNLNTPINSKENDFAPTISADGKTMIFNSNRNGKYQDLFISYNKDGKWTTPAPINELNSPYNDETPYIYYEDGSMILLFSSDRDGSCEMPADESNIVKVSFDIYYSIFENNTWSPPLPILGDVNTIYHEKYPTVSKDGQTLYYAVWSFGQMETSILMQAEMSEEGFINKRPMPKPFNTGNYDLALIPAEDLGGFFFSSIREKGFGNWDLYFISYKNGKFGTPENLGEKLNSKENDLALCRADQRYFICSNREGSIGDYDIYSSFIFQEESFETRAIHFDYNSDVIKDESFDYLNALAKYLSSNNKIKIEIIGHTDLHGSVEFNLDLSKRRALSVKNYLVSKGIEVSRLTLQGAGKSKPVIDKMGEGFDELNRRTEFIIKK